jgi:hypothetical protein
MNNPTWKLICGLIIGATLCPLALNAQTSPPFQVNSTGTNPVDFEFRADGTLIVKGNSGVGSLLSTDNGAGNRFLWYPGKGALRAGTVTGSAWNDSSIGVNSIALGVDDLATGIGSVALGGNNNAANNYGIALGYGNYAGTSSVALGLSCTANSYAGQSVAIGQYATAGYQAAAIGYGSTAPANWTFAAAGGTASQIDSISFGTGAVSAGYGSISVGHNVTGGGDFSAAFNNSTYAGSYCSVAMGSYNIGGGSATTWVATDPLFELGNGQYIAGPHFSDAFIVYKNGNATFQGAVSVAAGGDIPMYTGH